MFVKYLGFNTDSKSSVFVWSYSVNMLSLGKLSSGETD